MLFYIYIKHLIDKHAPPTTKIYVTKIARILVFAHAAISVPSESAFVFIGGGGGVGMIALASACTLVLPRAASLMLSLPSLSAFSFVILLRLAGFL